MPVSAECTTSTCAPLARRAATTAAMFRQLASVATLVPPNLSTIQGATACVMENENRWGETGAPVLQFVVERVFEILLELAICQHFFELAPSRLATFDAGLRTNALVHTLEQAVVIGAVLGSA